jgi:hypothetical protein
MRNYVPNIYSNVQNGNRLKSAKKRDFIATHSNRCLFVCYKADTVSIVWTHSTRHHRHSNYADVAGHEGTDCDER